MRLLKWWHSAHFSPSLNSHFSMGTKLAFMQQCLRISTYWMQQHVCQDQCHQKAENWGCQWVTSGSSEWLNPVSRLIHLHPPLLPSSCVALCQGGRVECKSVSALKCPSPVKRRVNSVASMWTSYWGRKVDFFISIGLVNGVSIEGVNSQ